VTENEDVFKAITPIALNLGVRIVSLMTVDQADRKLCVVRIAGTAQDAVIDALWTSGHTILNVLKY
jgi:hypothetical protein